VGPGKGSGVGPPVGPGVGAGVPYFCIGKAPPQFCRPPRSQTVGIETITHKIDLRHYTLVTPMGGGSRDPGPFPGWTQTIQFESYSVPRLSSQVRCPSRATSHSAVVGLPGPFILLNESFPTGLPAVRAFQREPHPTGSNLQCQLKFQPPTSPEVLIAPKRQSTKTKRHSVLRQYLSTPPRSPHTAKQSSPINTAVDKAV
jgi:hypothetical protein